MKTPLISKKQFNKFKHLLPVPRGNVKIEHYIFIWAVLFVLKHGIPWRQLPKFFGNWSSIYRRFNRWCALGIFEKIYRFLGKNIKKRNIAMLDSTYIKAHRTSASLAFDGLPREIGRSSGGLTTKIHLLCNELSQPIDFCITAGQVHDIKAALSLVLRNLDCIKSFIADKAYDATTLREILKDKNVCIPPKSNRKKQIFYDCKLYAKRHIIENMFAKIKDLRGIAMRYCRCATMYFSFVCLGLVHLFFCVN